MTTPPDDADAPSPEELAAYIDGRLAPEDAARVARWLGAPPDGPCAAEWGELLGACERRIARRRLAFAAALSLLALAGGILWLTGFRPPECPDSRQACRLELADESDVEVLEVSAADAACLLVGARPTADGR